jgi:hypothetical protein
MTNALNPVSTPWTYTAIAATIASDPLARDILRFLSAHESAMDTVKGIAAWWVQNDEVAVQPSLHSLVLCGVIVAHALRSGTTLYGLTQDSDVRTWLRRNFRASDDKQGSGQGVMDPTRSLPPA